MRVFLIHGMGRGPWSMLTLEWRLRRLGHRVTKFGYAVALQSFDTIVDRFVDRIETTLEKDRQRNDAGGGEYAVIGHSLGNIITRRASPRLPDGFERFVMLAPPNQSPAVARFFWDFWLFRLLTGDAGSRLVDKDFYEGLPVPEVPTLIIAGTKGPRSERLPYGEAPNDAIVSVDETRLADIPMLEVPAIHSFLMNRGDVFRAIRQFFEGSLDRAKIQATQRQHATDAGE